MTKEFMNNFYLYSDGKKISGEILAARFSDENSVGIFESLRTYGRRVFHQEEHLRRFLESAQTVGCASSLSLKHLARELERALEAFRKENKNEEADLFIRLNYWPASGGDSEKVIVMIGERKHPADLYRKGIVLKTSPVRRSLTNAAPAEAKTSAYQNAVMASLESLGGAYEWLFLDRNGFVTEVRVGNIFMVKSAELFTPPVLGILNGVTRRFVIECARQAGMKVKETPLTRHDFYNADEAFLTNTSWEILPVRELDNRRIGRQIPGPVTAQLQSLFKQRVQNEIHSQGPHQRLR
jgi:branched-chain amino acid aminotransferase